MSAHAPETTESKDKPSLAILIGISTVNPLAMLIYLPSLAGMMIVFSATAGEIQLSMSAFFVAVAVAQLFWGPLSDQVGRRAVIIAGMALFVVGTIVCLAAPTLEILILGRILQGAGGCTGMSLGRAIVRDLYNARQAASMIGYVTMGMAVMPTIAPAIGGVLDQVYGWRGGFMLTLVFGATMLWACVYRLPETHRERISVGPMQIIRSYQTLLRQPLYWSYAFTAAFSAMAYFAFLGGAPFIAGELLALSPAEMGVYFMFVALGYIGGNFLSGKFAERMGLLPMIMAGTLVGVFSVGLIAGLVAFGVLTAPVLFLPMFLLGLSNGVCLPSALSGGAGVCRALTGAAFCLTASLQVLTGAMASSLVAWLYSNTVLAGSPWGMILVMAFGMTASLIAALTIRPLSNRRLVAPAE